jgi:pyruvate,orthophosphate dikinase
MTATWVYRFDEIAQAEAVVGGRWDAVRALLGGKGANLAEMTRIGVPVPPGFTITTEACIAYLDAGGRFPDGLWEQVTDALGKIEAATGKRFGEPTNPLLLSCRSGAKVSMPGMMDTVLNLGLNDAVIGGLIALTDDPHFVYDAYRRVVQMFGSVVLGVDDDLFEGPLARFREQGHAETDAELSPEDLRSAAEQFKAVVERHAGRPFPADPMDQLRESIEAVFRSWNGRRAIDYRNAAGIAQNLGTAVNIQMMVFGNMGTDSATGVAMSRNATTGEPVIEGDYLINAQGEDVVAGTRATKPLEQFADDMPDQHDELVGYARKLEHHYRDMQDIEFTVEREKLWLLQTRDGKRTAQAAVRIAVDQADSELISRDEAIMRVSPDQVESFLHPQFVTESKQQALAAGRLLGTGLNVAPGAAVGVVAFDADVAQRWAQQAGRAVIMARPETRPDDVHGMLAAQGIVTSRGGRTSHAALVARQFGKPAVVGVQSLEIDLNDRVLRVGSRVIHEGEWISLDGSTGEVFEGQLEVRTPDLDNPWLKKILAWADEVRDLEVWANTDDPDDATRAREYGAEGIGLTRTEHMFFDSERLPIVQRMITAELPAERREALEELLPLQRKDFKGLFRAMAGLPVTIRLIDPPLHEFLPSYDELTHELADLKIRLHAAASLADIDELLRSIETREHLVEQVTELREANPMLGLRGVRLGIVWPELTRMQVRAIFEAACDVTAEGVVVQPRVMIPLVSHVNELVRQRELLESEARTVMDERHTEIEYAFGTMIEVPRAALIADELADYAEFVSFGTNDLTQMTFGISRDDAEASFLHTYLSEGILEQNPFATIDQDGVGGLMRLAVERGRSRRPDLHIGVCGEHGGDPDSIAFCRTLGLDYVSCSSPRIPVARLAAAQAVISA